MGALIKKISLWVLAGFFFAAGLNHFRNPGFYLPLIPPYLPFPNLINLVSGIAEILLSIGFLFTQSRKPAAILTILMLVAFIPSHVYFIEIGGCVPDGLCAPLWLGWVRLVIIHPLLMWWVWFHRS